MASFLVGFVVVSLVTLAQPCAVWLVNVDMVGGRMGTDCSATEGNLVPGRRESCRRLIEICESQAYLLVETVRVSGQEATVRSATRGEAR